MPTGYTADVQSGAITEFEEFVWRCARAMGALIMMRDEPWDAPVPERFEPGTSYYDERIATAQARLTELLTMPQAEVEAAAQAAQANKAESDASYDARKDEERARYEAMLAKVQAWHPPTTEHVGFKDFMVRQLNDSIEFDCTRYPVEVPAPIDPNVWHKKELDYTINDIARLHKNRAEEVERTEGRNRWLAELRASLATHKAG